MPDSENSFLNKTWLLNILVLVLIGLIGYQAHSYDNNFDAMTSKLDKKADQADLDAFCIRLDQKASRISVDLLSSHLQKQFDMLYDEVKGIRTDLNYYLRGQAVPPLKRQGSSYELRSKTVPDLCRENFGRNKPSRISTGGS